MPQFIESDLVPFAYESQPRATRAPAPPPVPPERDSGLRLLRSAGNPRDKDLSTLARSWLQSFAPGQRPEQLSERYPRLANRLALCWNDKALTGIVLKDLLSDRRGQRSGFPKAVHAELLALCTAAGVTVRNPAPPSRADD